MSKEERLLQTKIRMFEDILLRTKNPSQVDNIQMELTRMRAKLQKLYSVSYTHLDVYKRQCLRRMIWIYQTARSV